MKWYVAFGLSVWLLALSLLLGRPAIDRPRIPTAHARAKGAPSSGSRPSGRRPRLSLWDRVLVERLKQADALLTQAERLLAKRQYARAEARIQRAIRIRPYAASLHFALGTVRSLAGDYAGCVKALRRCRAQEEQYRPNLVAFRLGLCLSLSGRIAEGIQEYRKVKPGRWVKASVHHWNQADNYMALGRLTEAVSHYRQSLARNPGQRVVHFALAVALDRQGRHRAAERRMERALQLDPQARSLQSDDIIWLPAHDHHYYRALAALVAGRRARALEQLQRFFQAAPRSPWRVVMRRRVGHLRTRPYQPREIRAATPAAPAKGTDKGGGAAEAPPRRRTGAATKGTPRGEPSAKGTLNLDKQRTAAALTGVAPRLRACLGALPEDAGLDDHRAVRLELHLAARTGRLRGLRVAHTVGDVPGSAAACLRTVLSRLPWRRLRKESRSPQDSRLAFDVVR